MHQLSPGVSQTVKYTHARARTWVIYDNIGIPTGILFLFFSVMVNFVVYQSQDLQFKVFFFFLKEGRRANFFEILTPPLRPVQEYYQPSKCKFQFIKSSMTIIRDEHNIRIENRLSNGLIYSICLLNGIKFTP